jgi:2-polyprenyl-3-methyl-5-hydroxy-6-metoxy-1,4-benzoquinol methylase
MNKPAGYYSNYRKEMALFLPSSYSTVIDVGCGEGLFFNNLRANCEVWGVEPSRIASEIASIKLQNVLIGKYAEVENQIPEQYFDLVICNDVIKHIMDVNGFL